MVYSWYITCYPLRTLLIYLYDSLDEMFYVPVTPISVDRFSCFSVRIVLISTIFKTDNLQTDNGPFLHHIQSLRKLLLVTVFSTILHYQYEVFFDEIVPDPVLFKNLK